MRKLILIITSFLAVMAMYVFAQELPGNDMYHSEWHGDTIPVTFSAINKLTLEWYEDNYDSIRKLPLLQLNPDHGIDNLQTVLNSLTPTEGHSGYRVPGSYLVSISELWDTVYMFLSGFDPSFLLSKKRDGMKIGTVIAGIYVNKIGGDSAVFVIAVPFENIDIPDASAYTAGYKTDSLRTTRLFKFSSDSVSIVRKLRIKTEKTYSLGPDTRTCFTGKLLQDSLTGMLHFKPVTIRIPEQRLHELRDSLWSTSEGRALVRKGVCRFGAIL